MIHIYRNISTPIVIFGLELTDLVILLASFFIVFNISDHLFMNGGALVLLYFGLRYFKRGKPRDYFQDLMIFLWKPRATIVSNKDWLPGYLK